MQTIQRADEVIAKLQPKADEVKANVEKLQAEGQAISVTFKDAKKTRSDIKQFQDRLRNAEDRLADAQESANKDNDKEKAKRVAKIKKLTETQM